MPGAERGASCGCVRSLASLGPLTLLSARSRLTLRGCRAHGVPWKCAPSAVRVGLGLGLGLGFRLGLGLGLGFGFGFGFGFGLGLGFGLRLGLELGLG